VRPPDEVYDGNEYIDYWGPDEIILDGRFSDVELERIVAWMRQQPATTAKG